MSLEQAPDALETLSCVQMEKNVALMQEALRVRKLQDEAETKLLDIEAEMKLLDDAETRGRAEKQLADSAASAKQALQFFTEEYHQTCLLYCEAKENKERAEEIMDCKRKLHGEAEEALAAFRRQ